MPENDFSLEDRILCTDGACVGVIGDNGCCGVCGKVYDGDEVVGGPEKKEEDAAVGETGETPMQSDSEKETTFDPDGRVNCPDDMCVGIMGEDGKCGVCGKSL
jgi:hypothetical protein